MVRIVLVFILAAAIVLALGPVFLPWLRRLKFGQFIREDGPRAHQAKAGTPTMGGLMMLMGLLVITPLLLPWQLETVVLLLFTLGYGLIGFVDDYIKVVKKRNLGLKAKQKMMAQTLLALALAWVAAYGLDHGPRVMLPVLGQPLDLTFPLFALFIWLVAVGTTNAVNLTDGLDGLAAGVTLIVALTYVVIGAGQGQPAAALFASALAGVCLGFLYYNRHPARVFMGDTGSLALGGALTVLAVVTRTELLLPVLGAVYAAETLSVIIQVISFKTTGRRVFRMSPLHHHFELGGWSESRVVRTFWSAAAIACACGLLLWLAGMVC